MLPGYSLVEGYRGVIACEVCAAGVLPEDRTKLVLSMHASLCTHEQQCFVLTVIVPLQQSRGVDNCTFLSDYMI